MINMDKKLKKDYKKSGINQDKIFKMLNFSVRRYTKKIFKSHLKEIVNSAKKHLSSCEVTLYAYDLERDDIFNLDYYMYLYKKYKLDYKVEEKKNLLFPSDNDDIIITVKWSDE